MLDSTLGAGRSRSLSGMNTRLHDGRSEMIQAPEASRLDGSLDRRIEDVARSLREELGPVVSELVGSNLRPIVLARRLGIDKTLTGRLLRSLSSGDAYEVVHNAPAPHGLRIFLSASIDAGVSRELCERAGRAVAGFESLIDDFPEGRAALEAAISDHIPEVRQRNERDAKQAVYKSMAYLLGYQSDASVQSTVLTPSADGKMVDSLHIGGGVNLRRLRGRAPINIFGVRQYEMQPGSPTWIETLDGRRGEQDVTKYLLLEDSDSPLPKMSIQSSSTVLHIALDAESMPLNVPVTLYNGWISRSSSLRYSDGTRTHEWHAALVRIPTRLRVQDYFIHRDIWPGTPEMQPRMHGLTVDSVRSPQRGLQHDAIDMSAAVTPLGEGIEMPELRMQAVPNYQRMLRRVFGAAGLDASQYRAYRCAIVYPVPFVSLTAWFKLPAAPPA